MRWTRTVKVRLENFSEHLEKTTLPPISAPEEKTRANLTSSGEIQQLEELLKKKKEEKQLMDHKYRPIVEIATEAIKKDNLNYKLVIELIAAQFSAEQEAK
jgi:hypothetical protein